MRRGTAEGILWASIVGHIWLPIVPPLAAVAVLLAATIYWRAPSGLGVVIAMPRGLIYRIRRCSAASPIISLPLLPQLRQMTTTTTDRRRCLPKGCRWRLLSHRSNVGIRRRPLSTRYSIFLLQVCVQAILRTGPILATW